MNKLASPAMVRRLPPYCIEDVDKHGNVRVYDDASKSDNHL